MSWLLTSLVGGGAPKLPFTLGEPYADAWGAWTHYRATGKDDPAEVSVFKLVASPGDPKLAAARNGVKRLRTLRHPNVLQFKDSVEVEAAEKGGPVTLFLVTEAVQPLSTLLADLQLGGAQRDEYIAMGLSQVAQAVSFLNVDCKMVHGNVCMAAVVVTDTLDWRLQAFDLMSEYSEERPPEALVSHAYMIAEQFKPEEVRKGAFEMLKQAPPWAVDAWGVGCLVQEVFAGHRLTRTEELRDIQRVPTALHKEYQRLLGSVPTRRLNPVKMLESTFFSNKLVDTLTFLEKLSLKDGADKDLFFRRLNATLDQLPLAVVQRKVLPLIAGGLEFGSAPGGALTCLLHCARGLPPDQFKSRVTPCVLRLFASTDRAVRVALLQHMEAFIESVSSEQMESVYEHLAAGFADGTAYLRELTLKSLLLVAPKMSQRTLNSNVLKHLAKLQMDEEPAIRANTTICLGNIARYLGDATCKRVLLNAFTRALKDPFPPARSAGLLALQATIAHYDAAEGALRVLPSVAPLTVDPDPGVRSAAFDVMDAFLTLLRNHHAQRASAPGADDPAAAFRPLASSQAAAKAASSMSGSLLGWAAGSVGALAAAIGGPTATTPEKQPLVAAQSRAEAAQQPRPGGPDTSSYAQQSSRWEAEELEDRIAQEEEAAARARLNNLTLGGSAASRNSSSLAAMQSAGDGWGGDADEPFEDMQPAPPPARAAAPLSTPVGHITVPKSAATLQPVVKAATAAVGAKPLKLGGGPAKLGASKLKGQDLDLMKLLNE